MNPNRLDTVHITGFRSIRDARVELRPLNVLIGANGAGKSNFVAAFSLLGSILDERLQLTVRQAGGAARMLHGGPKRTDRIGLDLGFGRNSYRVALVPGNEGSLFLADEWCTYQGDGYETPFQLHLGSGHVETRLPAEAAEHPGRAAEWALSTMRSWRVHHFHDTSAQAAVKQAGPVGDDRELRGDAGNLAAFLYRLRTSHPGHYERILRTVRLTAPFVDRLELEPDRVSGQQIRLEWRHRDSDAYFDGHMMSDGTLRFLCLATLLLQPEPPSLVMVDEPELGLHPFAITQLAEMLRAASQRTQLVVAPQSVTLLNQLDVEDLIVAEQEDGASVFTRPDAAALGAWLQEYGLGEVWEKNLLGGRPRQVS